MKLHDERSYLNQFLVWGLRQHDPANTQNIKSTNPAFDCKVRNYEINVPMPNSRYLSPHPATYLT